jgi:hypothetical protein
MAEQKVAAYRSRLAELRDGSGELSPAASVSEAGTSRGGAGRPDAENVYLTSLVVKVRRCLLEPGRTLRQTSSCVQSSESAAKTRQCKVNPSPLHYYILKQKYAVLTLHYYILKQKYAVLCAQHRYRPQACSDASALEVDAHAQTVINCDSSGIRRQG